MKLKKLSALLLGFAGMFVLSGCSPQDRSGTFYETFVKPMDIALSKLHEYVGSWGWSIVIITLIMRLVILPFMLNNYKKQNEARRGQELARPELEVVQAKQKAAREKEARAISNEEKMQARSELMELQREQMAIMKKYGANPLSLGGCLPLLLQMPFLTGLFYTLSNPLYSAGITESTFLGVFNLGTRSYTLPIIAFVVYAIQTRLTMKLMPQVTQPGQEQMQGQMQMMQWLSPIMITMFSFWVAGAVAVYYIVGGLFLIFQTYLGHALYPPYKPEKVKKQTFDPNKVTLVSNKKKRK
ncbi:YidC/Oxa1 family membrane protein insertase [Gemella cuniculi]|uniref:YidC/Oxa1 family membrane protein insertase n=1 Tax=Gemella cuniculi TaxID=150240 RepID=UPI0004868744|nr:membrane protein insertase YidC [Gemella cuniculi]